MRPFSTPLSRRLGLTYPLVAAPMFIISNREMLEKMDEHFRAQLDELKCALRRVRAPLAHNR